MVDAAAREEAKEKVLEPEYQQFKNISGDKYMNGPEDDEESKEKTIFYLKLALFNHGGVTKTT